jgi:hypothetical protein
MANLYGPRIVTDGLVLCLDSCNSKSYPGTGTSLFDLSGNGNNGTLEGGTVYDGNNLGAFTFNGSNGRIDCGTFSVPYLTVNTWVYRASSSGNQGICRKENGWAVTHYGGTLQVAPGTSWNWHNTGYIIPLRTWVNITYTYSGTGTTGSQTVYINGTSIYSSSSGSGAISSNSNPVKIGYDNNNYWWNGRIAQTYIYNRPLLRQEIEQNYNALNGRFIPNGTLTFPFSSPLQAQNLGYPDGNYYFRYNNSSSQLLEFKRDYYENKPWVCVFRSPYNSTATTNKLGLSMPMAGLLVQRDTLDIRAAVYWSNPITYNAVDGSGNNTADSGYSPRRVILGYPGGHGIYATNQNRCSWASGTGAVGAGWNGSTCGSFPNGLLWGTGQSNTATYANMSGIWSHWIYWE